MAIEERRSALDELEVIAAQIRNNMWVDPVLQEHLGSQLLSVVEMAGGAALDAVQSWLAAHCPPAVGPVRQVRQLIAQVAADTSITGYLSRALDDSQEWSAAAALGLASAQRAAQQWNSSSGAAARTALGRLQTEMQVGSHYAGALSAASQGVGVVLSAVQAAMWSAAQQAAGALLTWAQANAKTLLVAGAQAAAGQIALQVATRFGALQQTLHGLAQALLNSSHRLGALLTRAWQVLLGGGGGAAPPPPGPPSGVPTRVDPAEVQAIVDRLRATAVRQELLVTRVLQEAAGGSGAVLYGLDHRFKSAQSLARKITDEANVLVANGTTPSAALEKIGRDVKDVLRYTVQADTDSYMNVREKIFRELTDSGYTPVKSKNTWATPGTPEAGRYRGINDFWRSPDGYIFEVQFHTSESLAAKTATTELYERIRDPGTSAQERADLVEESIRISDQIPVPPGAVETRRQQEAAR